MTVEFKILIYVRLVYTGFSSSSGIPVCSSLSVTVSVRLPMFFISFFTPDTMEHGLREDASKSLCFFFQKITNCPWDSLVYLMKMSFKRVDFFINFLISLFCFLTCSSRFVGGNSSHIACWDISRFSSLGRGCRCGVVWPVVFIGVVVSLDCFFVSKNHSFPCY